MGSFKGYGRPEQPSRRRSQKNPKRNGLPLVEFLEERRMLSGSTTPSSTIPAPLWTPTDTNLADAQNGPMANLGVALVDIYQSYVQSGGQTSQLPAAYSEIQFNNGMVGMEVKSLGGDFGQFQTQLQDLGMQVMASSSYYGVVDGWAPVNELPTIARLAQTQSGQANYKPTLSQEYQGEAYNEGETSMFADVARTEFAVDGTGVTIGVLSDSVSQFAGGLTDSYNTGDLSAANPVDVVEDGPAGSTDEGRAMLENIHDVAPGASLAFATAADGGDLGFAQNITALADQAHANLINDDVKLPDDPMFQDGFVEQSVNTVTAQGVTYFSAAGNESDDGYLSDFRATTGSIPTIGSGTFMNFAPSGAANILLPVTTDAGGAEITFEYDQPYGMQEPAGDTNVVTSDVDIYVINSATGAVVVSAQQNQDNVAMDEPLQIVTIPDAGSYLIAVQVLSGPNPGHIEMVNDNENVDFLPSQEYGSAGGTYYPSSFGHETGANTIGVGATPWWATTPYLGQNPLANEPFSSQGPGLYVFNANGSPLSAGTTLIQNPSVTGPDGGNTSFFTPGQTINTTDPPFPGEPATSTNLVPVNQQNLPTFFGTSSATPNVTAVAALMLEISPSLTSSQIRSAMETTAEPMNSTPSGSWNITSGFGFVNAINAINAIEQLRVSSTDPSNGETVAVTPGAITVTFNKPVNFSTVEAGDLTFLTAPTGVTVTVGTPIAVDNPTDPTIIQFPISFTKPAGTLANGQYSFSIQSPAAKTVMAEDGKDLVGSRQDRVHSRRRLRAGRDGHEDQRPHGPDLVQQGTRSRHGHAPEHLRDPEGERDDVAALRRQLFELHRSEQRPAGDDQLRRRDEPQHRRAHLYGHAQLRRPAADRDADRRLRDRDSFQPRHDCRGNRSGGQLARRQFHRGVSLGRQRIG